MKPYNVNTKPRVRIQAWQAQIRSARNCDVGIDLKAPGEIVRASCRLITENAVDVIFHRGLSGTRDADQLPPD